MSEGGEEEDRKGWEWEEEGGKEREEKKKGGEGEGGTGIDSERWRGTKKKAGLE